MSSGQQKLVASPNVYGLILAAGKGTRMKSPLPKVLHGVAGKPMVTWIVDALNAAGIKEQVMILGADLGPFQSFLNNYKNLKVAVQEQARGTGDAVAASSACLSGVARPSFAKCHATTSQSVDVGPEDYVLITAGDTPALSSDLLKDFVAAVRAQKAKLAVVGMWVDDPTGYGRLVCGEDKRLRRIVEERDAEAEIKKIKLVNSGVIMAHAQSLFQWLGKLEPNNAQKEYYLTDCFRLAADAGEPAFIYETLNWQAFAGVNDRWQLADIESFLVHEKLKALAKQGVTLHLPIYCEADVVVGVDVTIGSHVSLLGATDVGSYAVIGAGVTLINSKISENAQIGAGSVLENCHVSSGVIVPPGSVYQERSL